MLAKELVNKYCEDGVVLLRQVFDQRCVEKLASATDRLMQTPSRFGNYTQTNEGGRFFNDFCNWRNIPEFQEFVEKSVAAQIVGELMRSTFTGFYHEQIMVKEARASIKSPWHQDQPYFPIKGNKMCSIWMPLDKVNSQTSLRVVKGSHKWGVQYKPRSFQKNNPEYQLKSSAEEFEDIRNFESTISNYEIEAWDLEPGDILVFHGLTLHSANANESHHQSRRVFITRWFGDDAVFSNRPWDYTPPINGGLKPGESMECIEFPCVWDNRENLNK